MNHYESANGERRMLSVDSGEIYIFITAESDNGQTQQLVEVSLDIGQAMQLRAQLDKFIEGK